MLTGLLVGFTVGAGFDTFETLGYAFSSVLYFEDAYTAILGAVGTLVSRSAASFFSGHHYFTGIFTAVYILFKRTSSFALRDLFQWRVGLGLFTGMVIHSLWNASTYFSPFWASFTQAAIYVVCVSLLILLINVGIAQAKIMEIFETASAASAVTEDNPEGAD